MIRVLFLLLSLCLFSCEDMLKAGKEADIELESLPSHLLPPRLSWNYYPGGVTHAQLLDRLPDAENPQNDDWGGIDFQEPSSVCITRAIIEFGRYIGGGYASDVVIAKSILRNMMGCVVLGSIGPATTLEGIMNLTPEDMP